jgi:predicted negative regulator of RcsB-dependent stress response
MKNWVPPAQQNLFALVAALLFTIHPLQTQAVTYIVQRATSMATLFYLTALWMYLKTRLGDPRHYRLALCCTIAAMLTKEISFTLPFTILLSELFFFPPSAEDPLGQKILRWTPFAAFLLIIPLLFFMNSYLLTRIGGSFNILPSAAGNISRWDYFLTQFRVERTYLRLLFFPVKQCIDYDYRISSGWGDPDTWAAFSLLFSIFILSLASFKKNRLLTFGVLWFFLTLSVESSIIPLADVIYEHRLYLPMFGFVLFLTSLLWTLLKSVKWFTAVALAIVVVFSCMTYVRNEVWQNSFTLWGDTAKKSPRKWRPYCSLGLTFAGELKDYKTAILYFNKALKAGGYNSVLLTNMASAYFQLGNSKASAYYQKQALAYADSENYLSRGVLEYNQVVYLRQDKKIPEAIDSLKKAVKANPQDHFLHVQLGELYAETGQENAAIASFRNAIELAPLSREGYDALASFYKKKGDQQKAVDVMVEYLKFKRKHKPLFGN